MTFRRRHLEPLRVSDPFLYDVLVRQFPFRQYHEAGRPDPTHPATAYASLLREVMVQGMTPVRRRAIEWMEANFPQRDLVGVSTAHQRVTPPPGPVVDYDFLEARTGGADRALVRYCLERMAQSLGQPGSPMIYVPHLTWQQVFDFARGRSRAPDAYRGVTPLALRAFREFLVDLRIRPASFVNDGPALGSGPDITPPSR
jgi:hypothetical protein